MEKTIDITQIIQGSIRSTFNKWENADMPYPSMTIKELSRSTGISQTDIINCILEGKVQLPGGFKAQIKDFEMLGETADQVLKKLRTPQNSRFYQETRALVWSEGQRYQRRFHLDNANAKGKPTRIRINGRVGINQLSNTKVIFIADDENANTMRRKEVKRKQEQRALLKREVVPQKPLTELTQDALTVFREFSVLSTGVIDQGVYRRVTEALKNGQLEFLQFTCPVIEATKLATSSPEEYLSTSPTGNNFESTVGRFTSLVRALKDKGISSHLTLVIGDTDEPDYVFPVLGSPLQSEIEAEKRKEQYKDALQREIKRKYDLLPIGLYRYSQLEGKMAAGFMYTGVSQEDLEAEIERMREFFGKGNYYDGLPLPTEEQLRQIAKLKFQAYARQGYVLNNIFPTAVLLQNEFPLELRTRMLNANNSPTRLPAIYPYGRSTSLY